MDDELKTVEGVDDIQETEIISDTDLFVEDPILKTQREDVAKMRASLLCCNREISSVKQALNNITMMRVFHELTRIIRYTELMDKLEAKMYESMEYRIEHADPTSDGTWIMMLEMQKNLQKSMSNSYNLLKPYLSLSKTDVTSMASFADKSVEPIPLDTKSRDSIRATAQSILNILGDVNE